MICKISVIVVLSAVGTNLNDFKSNLGNAKDVLKSSHRRCSIRKRVLRNFEKFTGKHLWILSLFLINFIKKEALAQVFLCEFSEISKNTSGGCFSLLLPRIQREPTLQFTLKKVFFLWRELFLKFQGNL